MEGKNGIMSYKKVEGSNLVNKFQNKSQKTLTHEWTNFPNFGF